MATRKPAAKKRAAVKKPAAKKRAAVKKPAAKKRAAATGGGGKKGKKPMSDRQKQQKAVDSLTALGKGFKSGEVKLKKRTGTKKRPHPNLVRANKASGAKRKGKKGRTTAGTPAGKAYAKAVRGPQGDAIREYHAARKWMAANPGKGLVQWRAMRKKRDKARAAKAKK